MFGFFLIILVFGVLSVVIDLAFLIPIGLILIVLGIINYVFRINQIEDLSTLIELEEKKEIYKKMASSQLVEFSKYLGDMYPEIEKSIFKEITPEKIGGIVLKYPEIKSNETIMELVSLINKKTSRIYDCELSKAEILCRIRTRLIDSKAWTFPGVVRDKI